MWAYSLIDSFVNLIAFFLNTHLKVLLLLFRLSGSEIFTNGDTVDPYLFSTVQ